MMKENKGSLRNIRVLKKSMIFLQSYDEHIATSTLKQTSTFATCGKVDSVKAKQNFKNVTTYVSYADEKAAACALAFSHLSSRLRVLFGTVQYCKYFMRKAECRNQGCVFLHVREKKNQIIVNDQIDEGVYDDHYDMALDLLEPDSFMDIKNIIADESIEESSLIKRGLRKASEGMGLDVAPGADKTTSTAKESELSTQESELGRDQLFQKVQSSKQEQFSKAEQTTVNREYAEQDYLAIKLIKKLVRQNNSKMHFVSDENHQQIHHRGKMMLYQIVKY